MKTVNSLVMDEETQCDGFADVFTLAWNAPPCLSIGSSVCLSVYLCISVFPAL